MDRIISAFREIFLNMPKIISSFCDMYLNRAMKKAIPLVVYNKKMSKEEPKSLIRKSRCPPYK